MMQSRNIDSIAARAQQQDAFGFLRLVFAILVIVAHTPDLIDNNRSREILTRLTGHMTFGDLAVYGFFIISGYLVSASYLRSSLKEYLIKRCARILPGYAVAFVISVLVIAPLGGGSIDLQVISDNFGRMLLLSRPVVPGTFVGSISPDAALNQSMWTIQYEFVCYLLVVFLGAIGLLRAPRVLPYVAVVALSYGAFLGWLAPSGVTGEVFLPAGVPKLVYLFGLFLTGACFYLHRDDIPLDRTPVNLLMTTAFVASFSHPATSLIGIAVFGGFLIVVVARAGAGGLLGRINARTDISYGVYLYAWPIEMLLIKYGWPEHLWLTGALTLLLAVIAGWLSWHFVERLGQNLGRMLCNKLPAMQQVAA